jgi:putative cofactor-binding repeat protein
MSQRQRRRQVERRSAHRQIVRFVATGGLATVGLAAAAPASAASPLKVTVNSKSGSSKPASNAATKIQSKGEETLADAIAYLNENVNSSANQIGEITFASNVTGTIALTGPFHGDLKPFYNDTEIVGPGAKKLTIEYGYGFRAYGQKPAFDATLSISGLTLKNSRSVGAETDYGTLKVTNTVIESNADTEGLASEAPTITASHDVIKGPYSTSSLHGNTSPEPSIGVFSDNSASPSRIHVTDSTISGWAWGIHADYGAYVTDSTVSGNQRGIYGAGPVLLVDSTVADNYNDDAQEGFVSGAGVVVAENASLFIIASTISGNAVVAPQSGDHGYGAGVYVAGDHGCSNIVGIYDSVIAGNTVRAAPGATGTTIRDPDVLLGTAGMLLAVVAKDSVIGVGDPADTEGAITFLSGDRYGTKAKPLNAKLGKLKNNGGNSRTPLGPVFTMLPLKGSPLIGKGAWKPFNSATQPVAHDERGVARPVKGSDIGAAEVTKVKKPHKKK